MKLVEIKYTSKVKELEKLNAKLERAEKALAKKQAAAEKFGVADMTTAEHAEWLASVPTDGMLIVNPEDVKKNGAWFDYFGAKRDVEDAKKKIEIAERNLAKAEQALDEYHEEVAKIADMKEKELLLKLEFEQEQKEWAKDGIKLEGRYYGYTPSGKRFSAEPNNGYTRRSLHCWSLWIDGQMIFTSGEFWRAYAVIKNN